MRFFYVLRVVIPVDEHYLTVGALLDYNQFQQVFKQPDY